VSRSSPQVQTALKFPGDERRADKLRLTEPRSEFFAAGEDSDGLRCKVRRENIMKREREPQKGTKGQNPFISCALCAFLRLSLPCSVRSSIQ